MARPVVNRVLNAPSFSPQAAPVNTFGGTTAGNELGQLAAALGRTAPALARLSDSVASVQNPKKKQEGVNLALELSASGKNYATEVKAGRLKPSNNPWFHAGLQEQGGRIAGDKYSDYLTVALANNPAVQNSTDLSDFDKAEQEARAEFLKQNAGDSTDFYRTGFDGTAAQHVAQARAQFADQIAARMKKMQDDQHYTEVYNVVKQSQTLALAQNTLVSLGGVSMDAHAAAAATIETLARNAIALNPSAGNATRINQVTAEALAAAAVDSRDTSILDLAKSIKTRDGANLAGIRGVSQVLETARNQVHSDTQQSYAFEAERKAAADKNERNSVFSDAAAALAGAGDSASSVDMAPFRNRLLKVDPDSSEAMYSLKDAYVNRVYENDPQIVAHAFVGAYDGSLTMDGLVDIFGGHHMNVATFHTLAEILQTNASAGSAHNPMNAPMLTYGRSLVVGMFMNEWGANAPEARQAGTAASLEFTSKWLQYKSTQAGKTATPEQDAAFVERTRLDIFAAHKYKAGQGSTLPDKARMTNPLPPTPVDWNKQPATDPAWLDTIEHQVQTHTLSDSVKTFLGKQVPPIQPTPEGVLEFIRAQRALAPLPVAP